MFRLDTLITGWLVNMVEPNTGVSRWSGKAGHLYHHQAFPLVRRLTLVIPVALVLKVTLVRPVKLVAGHLALQAGWIPNLVSQVTIV